MPKGVNQETGRSWRFKDRSGTRNGRLLFTRALGEDVHRHHVWEARCDCGKVTATATPHKTQSCGCLHREIAGAVQRAKALPPEVKRASVLRNRRNQRAKRKADPAKAMQARMSRLFRYALAAVNGCKTSSTFEMLGFTPAALSAHLERQFQRGMGWHNMNLWQIDHIVPASTARSEADVVALNQLSNLRPMWADENNQKKNKRTSLL